MKAYVLHDIGDFHFETVKKPVPGENEVLIAVKAAGICGSDIPRVYRTGAHTQPLIPGHEFAGMVEDVGEGVSRDWIGRRVGVFPLIPCGVCSLCQKRQYELCRDYDYIGSRRAGAFAEYVVVPAKNLLALPDSVAFETAAMLEPMAVAVHAMRRVRMDKSETVAVCGLGTIGLLLAMFLKEAGFGNIFVAGNKGLQRQKAIELGIPKENCCDTRELDLKRTLMEKTEGKGMDVFFECVGKNETIVQAMECTAPSGRIVLVGNPHKDIELHKDTYWNILRRQFTVHGIWNSSFTGEKDDDWHYVLDRLGNNKIRPSAIISHRYAMENLIQGFELMRDKKEEYIKVMALM